MPPGAAAESEQELRLTVRDRYNDFIERHWILWELSFAGLALLFVGLELAGDESSGSTMAAIELAQRVLTTVFVIEFGTRLVAARDHLDHLRRHWVDLFALAPPIRALRLLRLVRLIRVIAGVYRAGIEWGPLARHREFLSLLFTWLGLGGICALAIYLAERGINPDVNDPFDALWWGVGALTTAGSDVFPITFEGRFAAMLLALVGVVLFSGITATITSFLIGTQSRFADELERLSNLHERGRLSDAEYAAAKARVIVPADQERL